MTLALDHFGPVANSLTPLLRLLAKSLEFENRAHGATPATAGWLERMGARLAVAALPQYAPQR